MPKVFKKLITAAIVLLSFTVLSFGDIITISATGAMDGQTSQWTNPQNIAVQDGNYAESTSNGQVLYTDFNTLLTDAIIINRVQLKISHYEQDSISGDILGVSVTGDNGNTQLVAGQIPMNNNTGFVTDTIDIPSSFWNAGAVNSIGIIINTGSVNFTSSKIDYAYLSIDYSVPTRTATPTTTGTCTGSPTVTITMTTTGTVTGTVTPTVTDTITQTVTATCTETKSPTFTPSISATATGTSTFTDTLTSTQSITCSVTQTTTDTMTPTISITGTQTITDTITCTVTQTATWTITPTLTITPSTTATVTATSTFTPAAYAYIQSNTGVSGNGGSFIYRIIARSEGPITEVLIKVPAGAAVTGGLATAATGATIVMAGNDIKVTYAAGWNIFSDPNFDVINFDAVCGPGTLTFQAQLNGTPSNLADVPGTFSQSVIFYTPTVTCTNTLTVTQTITATVTNTVTLTMTQSVTPTVTVSVTPTSTGTDTLTMTATVTESITPTVTVSVTQTVTNTITSTVTASITQTITPTATLSVTGTVTCTNTDTVTQTDTQTVTCTVTGTVTATFTQTQTMSVTPTSTSTVTGTVTSTVTASSTQSNTTTVTMTVTATNTQTQTMSVTPTTTSTVTGTVTSTVTASSTQSNTTTVTMTVTATNTQTQTMSVTPTTTSTVTGTVTSTVTASSTQSNTTTVTMTVTATNTQTQTMSVTPTSTSTVTGTVTSTVTASSTQSNTTTVTMTVTATNTQTQTMSVTQTSTSTVTGTVTPTVTATSTSTPAAFAYIQPVNATSGDVTVFTYRVMSGNEGPITEVLIKAPANANISGGLSASFPGAVIAMAGADVKVTYPGGWNVFSNPNFDVITFNAVISGSGTITFQAQLNGLSGDLAAVPGSFSQSVAINTPTVTQTITQTVTKTVTLTATETVSQTVTATVTRTNTQTITATVTDTVTATVTASVTQTVTQTITGTVTGTVTATVTATVTQTVTQTQTQSVTLTSTKTITETATQTITGTFTQTVTESVTGTVTGTVTQTVTQTVTPTVTFTVTATITGTATKTTTVTVTETVTGSVTATITGTITQTYTPTVTNTVTGTSTSTGTATVTQTVTQSITVTTTMTITPTITYTVTKTITATVTQSVTATVTKTVTLTVTVSVTTTVTATTTPSVTATVTVTNTPMIQMIALAPGQVFVSNPPGFAGSPDMQEAGTLVTITVRVVDQTNWTAYPASGMAGIDSNQPAYTILDSDRPYVAGQAVFHVRFLKPDIMYSITAKDRNHNYQDTSTAPIPVTVTTFGNTAFSGFTPEDINTVVRGTRDVKIMSLTILNPNSGGSNFSLNGITITVSGAADDDIENIIVRDSSGILTTKPFGGANKCFVPLSAFILPGQTGQFGIYADIKDNAKSGVFSLTIGSPADILVGKLNDSRVLLEPSGKAYPYSSHDINIIVNDIKSSFYNFPNPFRAGAESTLIQYYLPSDSKVSLEIYDIIGRKVKSIVKGGQQAGGVLYKSMWDGKNEAGTEVLNGVYYAILKINGSEQYHTKIAVVK